MRSFWKYRREIAIFLLVIFIVLFLYALYDKNIISKAIIVKNRDFYESISKIISTIIILIGAVFSYFKFFKGRIFTEKLTIGITCELIKNRANNLHVINAEFKNVGDSAIWYPSEKIESIEITENGHENISIIAPHSQDDKYDLKLEEFLIEPEETAYRHFKKFVAKDIIAVTYKITITSKRGGKWSKSITMGNK